MNPFSFNDIPLEFPDAFRGQYFIDYLDKESAALVSSLQTCSIKIGPLDLLLKPLFDSLAQDLDQMILPVIIHEIAIAKATGMLSGGDSRARYSDFFVHGSHYTLAAKSVPWRYPLLFKMTDSMIGNTFKSALDCIEHLMKDCFLLRENRFIEDRDTLESFDILGKSDPHLNQRAFLLTFKSGKKVIHKAVDLTADQLFGEFLHSLALPDPYDLKNMRTIPIGHEYGWIEYIPYEGCTHIQQIQNFYRRAGALIAVADCLNYSDGHFENLLAAGEHPILLDRETLFQNYMIPERKDHQKKNLLGTNLIQKPPSDEIGYAAAFQSPPSERLAVIYPYALRDQTDEIELRYQGINSDPVHNCPSLAGEFVTVHGFIDELIEGFSFTFDHIKSHIPRILGDADWWNRVAKVRSRTVLRETMAYCYLLRRIQRPEACISEVTMRNILEAKLGHSPYTAYEIDDLIGINVPYFYHYPGERHLYQGNGQKHPNLFLKTGLAALREQFGNWDDAYKSYSIDILKRQLPLTPTLGELTISR